jgi:NADPH:quinone reductase-like Zn-dependent oxidoreductase
MKAAQLNSYGGKDALKTVDTANKPIPGANQILVEVFAASLNPFDWKVREGYMKDYIPLKFPATLGGDVSGIVSEIGNGVSGFNVGDEVYGQANATGGIGSYAEYTPVAAQQLAPKPKKTDFVTAAAIPLVGVSAYQALVEHANLQSGQKILIHGGAGGIGTFAIQLAKHLGAHVVTTVSANDADYVKELGADEIIDYQNQDFSKLLKDFDVVFDTVGGETYKKSYDILKNGGTIVSMVEQPIEDLAKAKNIAAFAQQSKPSTEKLTKIAELVDQGIIKINVDKVFPLDEAAEALEYLKDGKYRGKVVIKVK